MSSVKQIKHSWGSEQILCCGSSQRIVRIYSSSKKVTIDLSQVKDKSWDKFVRAQQKYPNCTKIQLDANVDVQAIVKWWLS